MNQRSGKNPFFILFLGLIFLGLFICFLIWSLVFKTDYSLWNSRGRVNIFVNSKPALLLSLNNSDNSLSVVSLFSQATIDATGGYGNYQLGKIYRLDDLEKKHGQLVVNSIGQFLGIPIDGYIDLRQKTIGDERKYTGDVFLSGKEKILSLSSVLNTFGKSGKGNSNLSFPDLLNFYLKFQKVNLSKLQFMDLLTKYLLIEQSQGDRPAELIADPALLDNYLGNFFTEQGLIDERLKGEVLNSTNHPGLAEKGARVVTNIGGQVVNTGNFSEKLNKCRIYTVLDPKKYYTISKIAKVFSCDIKNSTIPDSRADYSVVLGDSFKKMLIGEK